MVETRFSEKETPLLFNLNLGSRVSKVFRAGNALVILTTVYTNLHDDD